jgi:hypothetical protein
MNGFPDHPSVVKVVRAKVMSGPQVTFPFTGRPEINIVAEVSDDEAPDKIVAVVVGGKRKRPNIGDEISVVLIKDFYCGYPREVSGGVARYCLE